MVILVFFGKRYIYFDLFFYVLMVFISVSKFILFILKQGAAKRRAPRRDL